MLWLQCAVVACLLSMQDDYIGVTGVRVDETGWGYFSDGTGVVKRVRFMPGDVSGDLPVDDAAAKHGTAFELYTRGNPDFGQPILIGQRMAMNESRFNPQIPTKIIVHGFLASINNEHITNIKKVYLVAAEVNVIMVDWHMLAAGSYFNSVLSAAGVGRQVARLVTFLTNKGGASLASIHIIGHSLGAHVAGFAGAELHGTIPRITGLDPASPLFFDKGPEDRLDPSDAEFVDVIHSCGGDFGILQPVGHIDFYPNGGMDPQPGCEAFNDIGYAQESCSHRRAVEYFTESVTSPRGFPSLPCESWLKYLREECHESQEDFVYMGDSKGLIKLNTQARGVYYLRTNSKFPFARLSWKKNIW